MQSGCSHPSPGCNDKKSMNRCCYENVRARLIPDECASWREPGTVLPSLVPHDEPLLAEVEIENKDIGFVAEAPVRLKLTAYPFPKYGMLEGTVRTISADASSGDGNASQEQQREPAFRALIELNQQVLEATEQQLPLSAGMQVSAEIVQGQRIVLEYLLSPVQRVVSEAGMER